LFIIACLPEQAWRPAEFGMSITYSQVGHVQADGERNSGNVALRRVPSAAVQQLAVVIEPRQLIRDCLTRALRATSGYDVIAFSSVEDWLNVCERTSASILLLSGFDRYGSDELAKKIQRLNQTKTRVPAILLSDAEDMGHVVNALNTGVKGYIPTNLSLDIAIEAMRLIKAGGVFVPAGCLKSGRDAAGSGAKTPWSHLFTARQAAVIDALRQGKANKTIAYELNLQESTVKVHIRNIMKKLKAKNRTQVAYLVAKLQSQN
jgi:DNA-binding NarL/FixJ family response regulator